MFGSSNIIWVITTLFIIRNESIVRAQTVDFGLCFKLNGNNLQCTYNKTICIRVTIMKFYNDNKCLEGYVKQYSSFTFKLNIINRNAFI